MSDFSEITINTDGGSRGNPGPSAIGVILKSGNQKIGEISEYLGITTNNVAEYTAVIKALAQFVHGIFVMYAVAPTIFTPCLVAWTTALISA